MPVGDERPRPTAAAPTTVNSAFYIYLVLAALAVLNVILVVTSGELDKALDAPGVQDSGLSVQSLVTAVRVTAIVTGVIVVALYVLFAVKMRAGRNWARIVLTVLTVLSLLSRFTVSASVTINGQEYAATSGNVVGWISAIGGLIAVVLMYLPDSNKYFDAMRSRR